MFDHIGRFMRNIQIDKGRLGQLHLTDNGPGHDIAGCQFQQLVITFHEPLSIDITQHGSLAAYRFRDQKPRGSRITKRRRMELDKFHVAHMGSGPVSDGYAVSGRNFRISSIAVQLSRPRSIESLHRPAGTICLRPAAVPAPQGIRRLR